MMQVLGKRIREARQALGLSQRQLAGREMTRSFISMIEAGKATPSEATLHIIAQRLGKPVGCFTEEDPSRQATDHVSQALLESARRYLDASQAAVAAACLEEVLRRSREPAGLAQARYMYIRCLRAQGKLEEARAECELALRAFLDLGDRRGVVSTYLELGNITFRLQDFKATCLAYQAAVRYCSELKTLSAAEVEAYTYLGTTLLRLGDLDEAIAAYRNAFTTARGLGDAEWSGRIAMGLGKAFLRQGDVTQSFDWTSRAIVYLSESGSPDLLLAKHNLAVVQTALGALHQALQLYLECLDEYRATGQVDKQASILEDIGWYWLKFGDTLQAKHCCREALAILEGWEDGVICGRLYRLLGQVACHEGQLSAAEDFLRVSYDLLRHLKARQEAEISLRDLRELPHLTTKLDSDLNQSVTADRK
jgi:tetratricopeptide (TPR) repeat protein